MTPGELTPISGIRYYLPPGGAIVTGLDGRVSIPLGGLPLPLLQEDFLSFQGGLPSYDAIGRGIYHALRANPDCAHGEAFARLLRDGYPHFLSEMASHIVMLDKKDVDIAYLDRKINYLKVFALIEPENPRFPLEIGLVYLDKGLSLSSLHLVTVNLYRAQEFLRRALSLTPEDVAVSQQLGEVSYLLGKYDDASSCWRIALPQLNGGEAEKMERRVARIAEGVLPKVPAVDYLQAIGGAFELHQQGDFEEASAILLDVMDDAVFREEFPLPEVSYIMGLCCRHLGMPRHAEDYFRAALKSDPGNGEFLNALRELTT